MSHLPFVAQAMLGIGPEAHGGLDPARPTRNPTLTPKTPTNFDLNWGYCENGSPHPIAQKGVTTLMGPPISQEAGYGLKFPDAVGTILVFVAERLRSVGYIVQIIPDDYEEDDDEDDTDNGYNSGGAKRKREQDEDDMEDEDDSANQKPKAKPSLKERELKYIRGDSYEFDPIEVFTVEKELVATFSTESLDNPWLVIQCEKPQITKNIYQVLVAAAAEKEEEGDGDFDLAQFPHKQEILPVPTQTIADPEKYKLEAVTGTGSPDNKANPTTLFSLYYKYNNTAGGNGGSKNHNNNNMKKKLVAKALCSYKNKEMDSVGPTLELIETASKWQRHGLGSTLMRAIHQFQCNKFGDFEDDVLFSVCYVTSFYASNWFQRSHRFRDLDGMGEELGKRLHIYEYELLDDEDDNDDDDEDDDDDDEGDY